jgi:hypothetical protein
VLESASLSLSDGGRLVPVARGDLVDAGAKGRRR